MGAWIDSIVAVPGLATGACLAASSVAVLRPGWITGWPRSVLALLALVSLAAASALLRPDPPRIALGIDASTTPLLPARDPGGAFYRRAVLDFGDDEIFVVAVDCGEVFRPECLAAMDRISARIAQLDGVRSVQSLLGATSFRWVEADEWVEIRPFIEEIPSEPRPLAHLRERALTDPTWRRTLVSDDARAAALNVRLREWSDADLIASGLDARVQAILADELDGAIPFHVAGRPHVKVHVYEGILHDLRVLVPLAVAVMAVVLRAFSGGLRGVCIPLATAGVAAVWTFGAMAWLDRSLTLLTGLLAPMLLAMASVYAVHVLARYEEEALSEADPRAAARRCLEHVRLPASLASLTTVAGFAALLVSDVPAVVELGVFAMLGVAASTLVALAGVPAVLALLPPARRSSGRLSVPLRAGLDRGLARLSAGTARHTRGILFAVALVSLVAGFAIPRIVIDTDYLSYFGPDDPIRRDFDAVNRLLAGAVPIYVVVDGSGPGSFREPGLIHALESLQRDLEALPAVGRTLSFSESLRRLNRAFYKDDPAQDRIPETRAGVSELLFMLPKADLARFVTVDHGRANLVVRTGEVGSAAILHLAAEIDAVLARHPLPDGARARVTGNALLLARSADGIARGQPWSVGLAAAAIFILVSLGLSSLRLGGVAMIPNLIPVLVFFGLLGLGIATLSLPTSLIGSMALGIAVDDTVHFLARYRAERRRGLAPEQAARRCSVQVGRPIAVTSFMLVAGFLVIAGSGFASLREFGLLSALTMAICLVTDLVLLPALLVRLRI